MAWAIPSLLLIPPDIAFTFVLRLSHRFTLRSSFEFSPVSPFWHLGEYPQIIQRLLCRHVTINGKILWKIPCYPADFPCLIHRNAADCDLPLLFLSRVASTFISVVLPAPLGPRSPNIPLSIFKVTFFKACFFHNTYPDLLSQFLKPYRFPFYYVVFICYCSQ